MLEAVEHLIKVDPKLGKLIRKLGPYTLSAKTNQTPFQSLTEAIIYQQLSAKAASTILKRFKKLYPRKRFPKPVDVLSSNPDLLRSAGLSRSKVLALQDLASKTREGIVPNSKQILKLSDEEILERLLNVRGVGPWTVEMLLIFKLGRADILPTTDLGIRKAFMLVYGRSELPTPKELGEFGLRWKPFRTVASWYLWRSLGGPY